VSWVMEPRRPWDSPARRIRSGAAFRAVVRRLKQIGLQVKVTLGEKASIGLLRSPVNNARLPMAKRTIMLVSLVSVFRLACWHIEETYDIERGRSAFGNATSISRSPAFGVKYGMFFSRNNRVPIQRASGQTPRAFLRPSEWRSAPAYCRPRGDLNTRGDKIRQTTVVVLVKMTDHDQVDLGDFARLKVANGSAGASARPRCRLARSGHPRIQLSGSQPARWPATH